MDQHMGAEGEPRPGFEDALANDLRREWRGGANPRWRIALWGAAAAALLVGVIAVATRDGDRTVTPVDTTTPDTALPDTSDVEETTATAPETSTVDTPETLPDPNDDGDVSLTATVDYLDALASGDYLTAATLLGRGGLEWEARADLRPLYRPEYGLVPGESSTEALAAALELWCNRSSCVQPASVGEWGFGDMRAVFEVGGIERVAMFVGYVDEGLPAVQGLPLQQPPAYDWVTCPDDGVMRQAWADLDGDGWMEQLVVRRLDDSGTNTLSVCGTALRVEELEIVDGEGLWVYAVNPEDEGDDMLLIGSVPPFVSGTVYRLEGGRMEATDGTFGFIQPMADEPGRSTGCRDLDDDGVSELVNTLYRYLGGVDQTDATGLLTETSPVEGGEGVTTIYDMVADADAAYAAIIGMCHGLPVATGN
jgi:hypothetical protein